MTDIRTVLDDYTQGRRTRLDPLYDASARDWDDVETLLDAFRRGEETEDAHLRHHALRPLQTAEVDTGRLAARLVSMVVTARDPEDVTELLKEMTPALSPDGVEVLVDHCRKALDHEGIAALWTHRYAFDAVFGSTAAPSLVVPWLCEIATRVMGDRKARPRADYYEAVEECCKVFVRHPEHFAITRPVLEAALHARFDPFVRPAGAALHTFLGSRAYMALVLPILEGERKRRRSPEQFTVDALIEPLEKAKADWSQALLVIAEGPRRWELHEHGPRLLRRVGLDEAGRARLERVKANKRIAWMDRHVVDALVAAVDAVEPMGLARFDRLPGDTQLGVHDEPPTALVDGGRVWLPVREVIEPAPPGEWSTDVDRFSVVGIDPRGGADVTFPFPLDLQMQPTGAQGAKRQLTLEAIDGKALVVRLYEPFWDHRGWGTGSSLHHLDRARGTWTHGIEPLEARDPPEQETVLDARLDHRLLAALRSEGARRHGLDDPNWECVVGVTVGSKRVLVVEATDPHEGTTLGHFVVVVGKSRSRS